MKGLFAFLMLFSLGFAAGAYDTHDPPSDAFEQAFVVEQSEIHSEVVVIEAVTHEVATEFTPFFAYEFTLAPTHQFLLSEEIDYNQAHWLSINTGNESKLSLYTQYFFPVGFVWHEGLTYWI